MMFTKSIYFMHLGKSMYSPSAMVAQVSSFFLPSTLRRSRIKRVKFFVSSGDELMPASELVGYSQSMSIPSSPYSLTMRPQSFAKLMRQRASAAISEKLPLVHPPTESTIFSLGFCCLRATTWRRNGSFCTSQPSKVLLTCPKA